MTGKGAPSRGSPARLSAVWNPCRFVSTLFIIMATWLGYAQARNLPLYYYNLAQSARANYERSLLTKRPDLIDSYYIYAVASHEDYVRAYDAFYGQPVQQATATTLNSSQVFATLQQDPGNIALNLRYAQLAEAEGAARKALIAYQRSLRVDPNNVTALAGLKRITAVLGPNAAKGLLPRTKNDVKNRLAAANANDPETVFSLNGGFRYATSASSRPGIIPRSDSAILNASGSIFDERSLGKIDNLRLRTDLYAYSDFYPENPSSDYDLLSLKIGPVFTLASDWQLAFTPFGEISFLNYKRLSHREGAAVSIENLQDHWLNTVVFKLGRENFSSKFQGRNTAQADFSATFALYKILSKDDYLFLSPGLAYNNANQDRFRYLQPAISAQYENLIIEKLLFRADISYFSRIYDGSEVDVAGQRRDFNITAGPSLTYKGFILDSIDIVGRYSYKQNWSNDSTQQYESHSTGLNVKWDY
ncbi:hypothetical protein N9452_10290 [Alphaproteobacteria bacterium]|nr:hypothetical protein [Alphaproteobacteria bacterium]